MFGPVGGRLALFIKIKNKKCVSHGFKISLLLGFPVVLRQVTNLPGDPVARATILTEISSLLVKKAMSGVQLSEPLFLLIFIIRFSGDVTTSN